ncbi:hypothetical protein [Paraburkholderia kirstenboschensis]|uniref:Uncharacterized protein n=1 Tax=Paraburkholderia kirstenboschensis TaxID=1245436 RepID=A0ABZ0ESB0_9BURK|nr:hypothetical protein [Paraburkholderia kirstenboschensis]WOD18968.1 hypothetical protein RW095_40560 [Paraburkholderia kirstenboschensis]
MNIEQELKLLDNVAARFRRYRVPSNDAVLAQALIDELRDGANELTEGGRVTLIYVAASLLARPGAS